MKLAALNLLSEDEQRRLLDANKDPELSFPANATIAELQSPEFDGSPS